MKNFSSPLPTSIDASVDTFAADLNKIVTALKEIRDAVPSVPSDVSSVSVSEYNAALNRVAALEIAVSKLETPVTGSVVPPSAPTISSVVAGDTTAVVSFFAPVNDGGAVVTKYVVTASNGRVAEGTSSPITVTGLTNGQTVTFTMKAVNSAGTGTASATSNTITPTNTTKPSTPTNVTVSNGDGYSTLSWGPPASDGNSAITGYRISRDGVDSTGYGTYTGDLAATARSQTFTLLTNGSAYNLTVAAINANGVGSVVTVSGRPVAPATTPLPNPGSNSGTNPLGFKAFTMGASVTGAANGDFNRWYGSGSSTSKRQGAYSTWGQGGAEVGDEGHYTKSNGGKPWGILTSSAEYGVAKESSLGVIDVDVAPQFYGGDLEYYTSGNSQRARVNNHWQKVVAGQIDSFFTAKVQEIYSAWGSRQGKLYYRPFHEFNGSWYPWSVRNASDAANFVTTWKRFYGIFKNVTKNDPRFIFTWSPNRDSSYSMNIKTMWPGGAYVDALGLDYYDFGKATTEAQWTAEENRTQNGDGPVGIKKWLEFAAAEGVPLSLPEWGQQFGDNPLFINKMTGYFDSYRYTGSGSPSGKILTAVYHNLQGTSPDPNAGGDFFIQRGGSDYSGRANASRALRTWGQASNVIRWV